MKHKGLILSAVLLSTVALNPSTYTEAQEPIYDEEGNLVLDEVYEEEEEIILDKVEDELILDELILDEPEQPEVILDQPEQTRQRPLERNSVGQVSSQVRNVEELGKMTPESATYIVGTDDNIATKGSKQIAKVELPNSTGLPKSAWSFDGNSNSIKFSNSSLKDARNGSYQFNITFTDGSETFFTLKVLKDHAFEDYWQQNMELFHKSPIHSNHRDLELISSAQSINLVSLTIDGVSVPKSQYRVVGGTIIINKEYLATLAVTPRARVEVIYGDGLARDFSLEITEAISDGNTSEVVGCEVGA